MAGNSPQSADNAYGTFGDVTISVDHIPDGYRLEVTRSGESRPMILRDTGEGLPLVVPVVPDRPVVLVPDTPVAVLPGLAYHTSVLVPVWLRISCSGPGSGELTIDDIPSIQPKKTWSGSTEGGEPAYLLESAHREAPTTQGRHEFEVPLEIRNSSSALLWIDQLVVRVIHLDLFIKDDRMRSNTVMFDFRGKEQESRISFQRSALVERDGWRKISSARIGVSSDIIKKSFYWIRDLAV